MAILVYGFLTTESESEACQLAEQLEQLNRERQAIEEQTASGGPAALIQTISPLHWSWRPVAGISAWSGSSPPDCGTLSSARCRDCHR